MHPLDDILDRLATPEALGDGGLARALLVEQRALARRAYTEELSAAEATTLDRARSTLQTHGAQLAHAALTSIGRLPALLDESVLDQDPAVVRHELLDVLEQADELAGLLGLLPSSRSDAIETQLDELVLAMEAEPALYAPVSRAALRRMEQGRIGPGDPAFGLWWAAGRAERQAALPVPAVQLDRSAALDAVFGAEPGLSALLGSIFDAANDTLAQLLDACAGQPQRAYAASGPPEPDHEQEIAEAADASLLLQRFGSSLVLLWLGDDPPERLWLTRRDEAPLALERAPHHDLPEPLGRAWRWPAEVPAHAAHGLTREAPE